MIKTYEIKEEDMRGLAIRLSMLQTHYRKPKDFKIEELNQCAKILRRWLSVAVPCSDAPPLCIILALSDDLNTAKAIAEMHSLAKTDPKGLFAAMRLLGLIPGEGKTIDYDIVDEVKTIPIDHIPLVHFHGFETLNKQPL